MGEIYSGHGMTVTFGSSGFTAEILDVKPPEASKNKIDRSHHGSTDVRSFTPEALAQWGGCEMTIIFDPAVTPPIGDGGYLTETITIGYPDSAASSWSFTGWMAGYSPNAIPIDDKATARISIDLEDKPTIS